MEFSQVVKFHGHLCPGLAMGYRVAELAVREMATRHSNDEEFVAIVENKSCAIDAIQVVTGCTFGKGNLIFKDFGKQVYTFLHRENSAGLRIAVKWNPPQESGEVSINWQKYMSGDRSAEVLASVQESKARKADVILNSEESKLFSLSSPVISLPDRAKIHPSLVCDACGEKVMSTKIKQGDNGRKLCIPCFSV